MHEGQYDEKPNTIKGLAPLARRKTPGGAAGPTKYFENIFTAAGQLAAPTSGGSVLGRPRLRRVETPARVGDGGAVLARPQT
jgi:hypothetical protein